MRLELLRPEAWVEAHRLEVGRELGLDLGELGVRGVGRVVSIGPCPELEAGDPASGRIVTGRFAHAVGWPMSLRLEGLEEPIGVTGEHLFWSVDRDDWVAAAELEPLERVRVLGATLGVVNVSVSPRMEAVYNLEVDGVHVYRVTAAGVLVHNTSALPVLWDPSLAPVRIEFPIPNRSLFYQQAFVAHLLEQQRVLNLMSRFYPHELAINLANYGYNRDTATRFVKDLKRAGLLTRGDAAHALDIVAGGHPRHLVGVRPSGPQRTIGSLWRWRYHLIVPTRPHELLAVPQICRVGG